METSLIVEEARRWVGTPYRHSHRLIGAGVDCVGLVIGVGAALGFLDIPEDEWAPFSGYSRTPNPRKMGEAMAKWLDRIEDPQHVPAAGEILWLQWRPDLPMHLAIVASYEDRYPTMIHAFQSAGKCVEHRYSEMWSRRVNSVWRYRG